MNMAGSACKETHNYIGAWIESRCRNSPGTRCRVWTMHAVEGSNCGMEAEGHLLDPISDDDNM